MAEYDYEENFQEELKKITDNGVKHRLVGIKNLIVKRLALEKEFKALHNQLEAKYEALYRPLYDKRAKIVEGTTPVQVEDIKEQLEKLSLTQTVPTESEKGIPDFWLKSLQNSSQFGAQINKNDAKVLSHIKDITSEMKATGDFTLNFFFAANPYFEHDVLTREFIVDSEKQSISKIVSTKINWKSEEVNPTVEKKTKKIKNKKKGDTKTVTKYEEVESFFLFFKDYDINNKKEEEDDQDEEEEGMNEDEIIEEEYDLGLFVKEELIPYAIEYYLGVAGEDDFEGAEDGENGEDDEDDE
jgi:nucleosome assembly protein 1-like 1